MTHGGFKTVQSPYDDGEVLLAMPAVKLDAALLHVHRADKLGNIQALGPDTYYDEWFARAADKTFVSAEEVVERMAHSYPADARATIRRSGEAAQRQLCRCCRLSTTPLGLDFIDGELKLLDLQPPPAAIGQRFCGEARQAVGARRAGPCTGR